MPIHEVSARRATTGGLVPSQMKSDYKCGENVLTNMHLLCTHVDIVCMRERVPYVRSGNKIYLHLGEGGNKRETVSDFRGERERR